MRYHLSILLQYLAFYIIFIYPEDVKVNEHEFFCDMFLSNPQSTPSKPERDLSVDEEGEAACMQVLENDKTPLDLRLRIHEGLYVS